MKMIAAESPMKAMPMRRSERIGAAAAALRCAGVAFAPMGCFFSSFPQGATHPSARTTPSLRQSLVRQKTAECTVKSPATRQQTRRKNRIKTGDKNSSILSQYQYLEHADTNGLVPRGRHNFIIANLSF